MSGSFRWVGGCFMHGALLLAEEEPGELPTSQALLRVYKALQPVERACAWAEAGDTLNGPEVDALRAALPELREIIAELEIIAE